VPPRKEALSGTVTAASVAFTPFPEPKDDIEKGYEKWLDARVRWHEATACSLYRQIHACALALDRGLGLAYVLLGLLGP
jgi:hypothetical protein